MIKDLFQSKITRTGSLAPSARQQRSRRNTSKSPFDFFKKLRGGKADKVGKITKLVNRRDCLDILSIPVCVHQKLYMTYF